MRYYELMMLVAPSLDDESLSGEVQKVNEYVSSHGGSVVRQSRWGRVRRLAYSIDKFNEGNYVLTHLEMKPEDTKELETNLNLNEGILRYLLLKIDSLPEIKEQNQPPQAINDTPKTTDEDTTVVEDATPETTDEDTTVVEDDTPKTA